MTETGTRQAEPADAAPDRREMRSQSRVEFVIEHIKHELASGRLQSGDRLPSEVEVAIRLGVSRTPVREAIKILDSAGVLEIRRGSGTFVRSDAGASLAQLLLFQTYLSDTTPRKLMEVRQVFERSCAELAAGRRTDEDLTALRIAIDRLKRLAEAPEHASLDEICDADLAFHRALYEATHNELISTIATFVLDMVAPWVRRSLEVAGPGNAVKLHEMLYAMIENRNAGGAREMTSLDPVEAGMDHFRITLEDPASTPKL